MPTNATSARLATSPPAAKRSRGRRALHALVWSVAGLLALALILAAGAWGWLGSSQSLAFTLAKAARYLPAGQTLESRGVTGSLRSGGHIAWLRWQSESMAVEVRDVHLGWSLAPLLQRKVRLGEFHATQLVIERRAHLADQPGAPLEQLVLPIDVELPFRIDDLRWQGAPPVGVRNLAGTYRYADAHHSLEVTGVDLADGHYSARATLQGPAPMALDAALTGRVKAPLAEGRSIDVVADATLRGALSGTRARLKVAAELKPAEENADAAMQAQLQAQIAPWLPQPLVDAQAGLRNVDAASLWPGAPRTLLIGTIDVRPDAAAGATAWQGMVALRNALPGPWDEGKLPLEQVEAEAAYDGTTWTLRRAELRLGGGRIEAEGRWNPTAAPSDGRATVRSVRPGLLHSELAGAPLNGRISAQRHGDALSFDLALQAEGGAGAKMLQGLRLDRALAQGQWRDQVLDLRTLRIEAERASVAGRLHVRVAEHAASGELTLVIPGGRAQVQGRITPTQGEGKFRAAIDDVAAVQRWVESLPRLATAFAGAAAEGTVRLDANWQGGWQPVLRRLQNVAAPERGTAEASLTAALTVPRLDLRIPPPAGGARPATAIQLRGWSAELAGSLAQATLALKGEASTGTHKVMLDTRASGGLDGANRWRVAFASLRLQAHESTRPGPWTLELTQPVSATVRTPGTATPGQLEVDASGASATLRGPLPGTVRLDWQPLRLSRSGTLPNHAYRLRSQGKLQGLPMAWAEALGANSALADVGVSGDLVFDGDWDIDAGDALGARVRLGRQSGDIRVQAGEGAMITRVVSRGTGTASERTLNTATPGTGPAGSPGTPAGLRQAELRLDAHGADLKATLVWDSERAGRIDVEAATRVLQRDGGWQWAPDAPLTGRVSARLPSLGVWSMLAPPGWRVAGTLDAAAALSGSRAAPRWSGTLGADQLALRASVEGLDLRDGRLRATLAGDRVEITEFTLHGGVGSITRIAGQSGNLSTAASEAARGGGSLAARGELRWGTAGGGSGIRMALDAQLRRLRVLVRSDRQMTLSGDLKAHLDNGQFSVRGALRADRAVIILPDETAPSLGSDVAVRSAAKDREAAQEAQRRAARSDARAMGPQTAKPPDVLVNVDLGQDFAVQGRGLTTRLEGQLAIRSTGASAPPRVNGELRTVRGRYRAYGQELDVETGIARFSGPVDNPALDILAIRPNISHRAGVQIGGSAQSPRVRLYSEPALSDAETLSWVVLGRASATSRGESVLLQQAALALLGGLGKGGTGGSLASRFGLDEIGFKGPGSGGDLRESAVTVGKRISKDFYLTYERSLAGTLGTLFIFYDLTQRLTLRGQAGQQSGLDLIYTMKFD